MHKFLTDSILVYIFFQNTPCTFNGICTSGRAPLRPPNLAQFTSLKHQVNIIITTAESLQLRLRLKRQDRELPHVIEINDIHRFKTKCCRRMREWLEQISESQASHMYKV